MDNNQRTIEELQNEIVSLKIRLRRIEDFLKNLPSVEDYLSGDELTSDPDEDPLFDEAKRTVGQYERVSASLLQRKLSIGYARAARVLDLLQKHNVVGPGIGARPRKVLKKKDEARNK